MTEIYQLVASALCNAAENGYSFEGWTPEEIAIDMVSYDSCLEHYPIEEIVNSLNRVMS